GSMTYAGSDCLASSRGTGGAREAGQRVVPATLFCGGGGSPGRGGTPGSGGGAGGGPGPRRGAQGPGPGPPAARGPAPPRPAPLVLAMVRIGLGSLSAGMVRAGGAAGSGSAMGGSLVMRSGTWKELAITTCFGASFISSLLRGTKTATGVALGKALDSLCSVA